MNDIPTRGPGWTADTEIAFLLALRLTGQIRTACREIGRSVSAAYQRRAAHPDFAEKWRRAVEERHWLKLAAEQARAKAIDPDGLAGADERAHAGEDEAGEMPNRVRFDGWTPLRQRAFLRALAETGQVEKACRFAGISGTAARNMRERYPSFAVAWDRALAKSEPTLEQVAVDRAVNGVAEPVFHAGAVVGHRRRYSDALMREVLKREDERFGTHRTQGELVKAAQDAARAAGGAFVTRASEEETRVSLMKHLAALDRRLAAEAARKAAAGTPDAPEAAESGD